MAYATISTSTVGYAVTFQAESGPDLETARVSRTALLDGTVDIQHYGFTHGDRTKTVTGRVTETQAETLQTIFRNYTSHNLSADDGFFVGVIESVKVSRSGMASIKFLIKEKKS